MKIEVRQLVALRHDLRALGKGAHQCGKWLLHLEDNAHAAAREQRNIAAELQRVAKALLGVKQNGLAGDLIRPEPERLRKLSLPFGQLFGFPTPLILLEAASKVANKQPANRFVI